MKKYLTIKSSLVICFLAVLAVASHGQVTYVQQIAHYNAASTFGGSDGGGIFNNGAAEVGMYANNTGAKQCVAWRKFKTLGDNTGSDVSLAIGNKFTITVAAKRAYGKIGVALLASPTTFGSWANREENYAVSVNLDGPAYTGNGSYGNWYTKGSAGATTATSVVGDQTNYNDFTIQITITATDKATIVVSGNGNSTTLTNVTLNTTNPITHYSIFLQDDWSGIAQSNIYWKQATTLPVELIDFKAVAKENTTLLNWSTASEKNNDHFEVERSHNATNWQTITTIKGHGTTNYAHDYNYTDVQPNAGVNYYRLKQVDDNGAFTYSKIVSVLLGKGSSLKTYPNPATTELTILGMDETGNVQILDVTGKVIKTATVTNSLNINELPSGVYFVRGFDAAGATLGTTRFVKK